MQNVLNKSWTPKRLDELGFVGRGKSRHRPRNDPSLYGGLYPFIQTAEIVAADCYITSHTQTYSEKGLTQSKMWDPNTLCISIAGENTGATAILKFRSCFPDSVIGFVADREKSDVHFVKYALDFMKNQIRTVTKGATQDNLSVEKLLSFPILAPPLPTQRRIAGVLAAYDDLIENNTRRIKVLEKMAQALYREWFVRPCQSGKLPKGWKMQKLSELVETQYGYTESASETPVGPKYVRGMDINKTSYIEWDTVPYCPISDEDREKYKLAVGDVMVIRMADPGKVGIVEKQIDGVFASYLIRLKITSPKLSPYFLFYFLLSDRYQGFVTGASTGTTRKSASAGVITDIEMVIPPDNLREKFEEQAATLRGMLNNLLDRNANLRRTRDLLLPKLISGGVDVSALDVETGEE